jgi:hypothetical protein
MLMHSNSQNLTSPIRSSLRIIKQSSSHHLYDFRTSKLHVRLRHVKSRRFEVHLHLCFWPELRITRVIEPLIPSTPINYPYWRSSRVIQQERINILKYICSSREGLCKIIYPLLLVVSITVHVARHHIINITTIRKILLLNLSLELPFPIPIPAARPYSPP